MAKGRGESWVLIPTQTTRGSVWESVVSCSARPGTEPQLQMHFIASLCHSAGTKELFFITSVLAQSRPSYYSVENRELQSLMLGGVCRPH
jgi:hypothetical protein